MFIGFPSLINIYKGLEVELHNWYSKEREYRIELQRLRGENRILYRERLNLVSSLGFLRLVDDTLERIVDILIKVKALLISSASKGFNERKFLQSQINELVRSIAQLINGFSYDGVNPFKGDPYVIRYGDGKNDYIVVNGTSNINRKYGLVFKIVAGRNENIPSQISIWNRYYWPGVKKYGIALWASDGKVNYRINLTPPPKYIGIPPIILFPGDPPFYWPPYINELIRVKFTFYVATENQTIVENSIEEVERAIKIFEKIRGFYGAIENKILNLIEFSYIKENGVSYLGKVLEELKLFEFLEFNLRRKLKTEVENLLLLRYLSFYSNLMRLLFGS